MPPAAKYRERVQFQRRSDVDLGGGESSAAWIDLVGGKVWAEVLSGTADQFDEHSQQVGEQVYRVTVRKSTLTNSITNQDRLVWRCSNLNVAGISFDPAQEEITFNTTLQKGAT
jgi:head-tail adaptor